MRKTFRGVVMLLLAITIAAVAPLTAVARLVADAEEPVADVGVAAPAAAQPMAPEASMEAALIAVKSLIGVDDDVFTEFSYSSRFSNFETREGLVWSFSWSCAENTAYIYAEADADGVLLHFSKFDWSGKSFGFAELSREAATAKADEFIKRANPDTYSFYKAPGEVVAHLHNSDYTLQYTAQVNGHDFGAARISVNVNKFTGEVTGYFTNNIDPGRYRFEEAADFITEAAAVAAYAEKIGLTLEYRSRFDFESRELTVFPVYLFNSFGDRYIGARTGDVVEYIFDLGIDAGEFLSGAMPAPMMEAEEDSAGFGGAARITPAEREAIEQVAGFLTSEQALAKLLEAAEITDLDVSSFTDQHIVLNRDFFDTDRFSYNISLFRFIDWDEADDEIVGVFGEVDATTGRLRSFSISYNGTPVAEDGRVVSAERAGAAVEAFLRRVAPNELAKSRLEQRQPSVMEPLIFRGSSIHFSYVRHENGVPFRENGIHVTFNQHTGRITSYHLNWHDNVTFPGIGNVLTPERALAAHVAQNGSEIFYITVGEGNAALVYDFDSGYHIDPFTGGAIDFMGAPLADSIAEPAYSDVAGHWSEKYVTRLLDNGVFLWGGRFEPEKAMTELEFLQYIMLVEGSHWARIEPDDFLRARGIEIDVDGDRTVTRQSAARIIVEYLGYGKLAEHYQWFVYPFSDYVAAEYRGYITICHMLGIIGGDGNGRFNAANNVARGQAAVMLHNLILSKS